MEGNSGRKMVLVVEDSKLLRTIILDALKIAGFGTYAVDNGRNGLSSALQVHPDLIILDVVMPIMDGIAMYQKLRKDDWGKKVPVILLSREDEHKVLTTLGEQIDFIPKDDAMVENVITKVKSHLGISQ